MGTTPWMTNLTARLAIALAALALPALAAAATHVVDDDGTYDAGTTTCDGGDAAFTLIQPAVTAAANGDTILVCPGTYAEAQITLNKALTVQSVAGAATTIIDGTGGTGLAFSGTVVINATAGAVLFEGFTVRNAKAGPSSVRINVRVGSTAAVDITVRHNLLLGTNNPADGSDYGLYAAGPNANDNFVFESNELREHGSNPILIERHSGPTDVRFNTFNRGVRNGSISAYINMSHSGTAVTALQRVHGNTIDLGNDPGPYTLANSSTAIVFRGSLVGTSLGTYSNVEISNNTITNLRAFRRGIALANTANTLANQHLGLIANAVVTCNAVSGPLETQSYGIQIAGYVTNTTITNNAIDGADTGIRVEPRNGHIADTATAEINSLTNSGVAAIDWQPTGALAAEDNWWGDASGPTHASNPGGTGSVVLATGPVDVIPWLDSPSDASLGPCFVPGCGNGTADLHEDCDAGGLNGDPSTCCTTTCNFRGAGEECRAAAGVCDPAETCSGAGGACPADAKSSAVCRAAAGACDVAESCDGIGDDCPSDAFAPAVTVCRAAAGTCDVAENCPGSGPDCPADAVATASTVCRAAAGPCDIAETCDGVGTACAADAVEPASTTCRAAAGGCDVAESCDGAGTACPADAVEPATTVCRTAAGTCDLSESCDGASPACPADAKSGAVCRPASGACDLADACDGIGNDCPADAAQPDGTNCDDAAFCNGVQTCGGGVCGGDASPCNLGETCDEGGDLCFAGACPTTAVTCDSAGKNTVLIRNKVDDGKDKVVWKWARGAATTLPDFADPTTTATYALCFYTGPSASLLTQAVVPPAGGNWLPIGTKGFKYRDNSGTHDGITKIVIKSGSAGKSRALVKGKGLNLPDFDGDLPIANGDLPLIVQLRNNGNGRCWQSSFATAKKNQSDQFRAKAP